MTELLEKALAEVAKLPVDEQEAFAAWILQELGSECRWRMAFAGSSGSLAFLADEARAEHARGETKPLDPREG